MTSIAILLLAVTCICLILGFWVKQWRAFLLVTAIFALFNSYVAAPQNWISFLKGKEFLFVPIAPTSPPVPIQRLALPTDTPERVIEKMGCHVCHKIPHIPASRFSNFGPLLIPKTTAPLQLASSAYQARVKIGKASATTPREYVMESILNPNAFIMPGYEKKDDPEKSMMYHHYDKRFTAGGLETLVDYLLTLDVDAAANDGLIFAH